jgi:hypothetical protein
MANTTNQQRRQGDSNTLQDKNISTYGLNAPSQELAGVGEPIHILFGERTQQGTGGFVHAPQLIYQRMHSAGTYEWARIGFVMGEGGISLDRPPEQGFRIGSDLLHSKQAEFWKLSVTNGSTADNDPTESNTLAYGNYNLYNTLTANNEFFTIQWDTTTIRGFSQSFDPGKSFGLEGEPPDCENSTDQDFTVSLPNPTTGTNIEYNPVAAEIANTRVCNTTEFGFGVTVPPPSLVPEEDNTVPVGSKWTYNEDTSTGSTYLITYLITDGTTRNALTQVPHPIGRSTGQLNKGHFKTGTKVQIISPQIAFYALYHHLYDVFPKEDLEKAWGYFQTAYGAQTDVLFIKLDDYPSWIYHLNNRNAFLIENQFIRTDGIFDPNVYNPYTPCELPVTDEILKDPRIGKVFFKLFYRKISSTTTDWRPVWDKPFCLVNPNISEIYTGFRLKHPGTDPDAYEYKLKPLLPDQVNVGLREKFERYKYGILTTPNDANRVPVLYPSTNKSYNFVANDGFRVMWEGYYEHVVTDTKLNEQTTNYSISIRYVNEGLKDSPDYPNMGIGVLTVRGGKSLSDLSQLLSYHDKGAQITKVDQTTGTSNLFPDLCYHLLTYYPGATGSLTNSQINLTSFTDANAYTKSKSLFYDGVITERVGAHEFISEHAKFFLHRFGISNGVYTLFPALIDSQTKVTTAATSQTVTLDIIVPDSLEFEYATLAERGDAYVTITYRRQNQYMPGENETVTVSPATYQGPDRLNYDLSGFCTSKEHAITVARFLLAMRKQQDKTVTFTCFKSSVDLSPGRLFKFNLSITTSSKNTFTEQDQYQVTSTTYREDGLLDIRAVRMPTGMSSDVFSTTTYPEVL